MSLKCPAGHDSVARDFCSECGLEMPALPNAAPVAESAAPERVLCPVCQTERDDSGTTFCGVCGYNFTTGQSGATVSKTPVEVQHVVPRAEQPERVASVAAIPHIDIEVTFDESNAEAPKGVAPRKFSLYDEESLIGRRSSSVPQTIGIEGDDCISRRQLLIIRQPGGSYVARLFDNTNGGTLNGNPMAPGLEISLSVDDTIVIGAYTCIRVTAIQP